MKTAFRFIVSFSVVLLIGACMRDDPRLNPPSPTPESEISVQITSPADGATIGGNVVAMEVSAEGLAITEPDGDVSGTTGHFHVFVDRDPVATGEQISDDPAIVHFQGDSVVIPGLSVGTHRLTVVLGDGSDIRIGRTSDVVEVEVTGPSINAIAPENAPLATGFELRTEVTGAQIAEGEDAAQGGTHLDLVVDPEEDPTANGQPLPSHIHTSGTTHQVAGLGAGEHTIWVVLTDQNHVPVSPLVADRFAVNIR